MRALKFSLIAILLVCVVFCDQAMAACGCGCKKPLHPARPYRKGELDSLCKVDKGGNASSDRAIAVVAYYMGQDAACYLQYAGMTVPDATYNLGKQQYFTLDDGEPFRPLAGWLNSTVNALNMTFAYPEEYIEQQSECNCDDGGHCGIWSSCQVWDQLDIISDAAGAMPGLARSNGHVYGVFRDKDKLQNEQDGSVVKASIRISELSDQNGTIDYDPYTQVNVGGHDGTAWTFGGAGGCTEKYSDEDYWHYVAAQSRNLYLKKFNTIRIFGSGRLTAIYSGGNTGGRCIQFQSLDSFVIYDNVSLDRGSSSGYHDDSINYSNKKEVYRYSYSGGSGGGGGGGTDPDVSIDTTGPADENGDPITEKQDVCFTLYYGANEDPAYAGKVHKVISAESAEVMFEVTGISLDDIIADNSILTNYWDDFSTTEYEYYGSADNTTSKPGQIKKIIESCSSCSGSAADTVYEHEYCSWALQAQDDYYVIEEGESLAISYYDDDKMLSANDLHYKNEHLTPTLIDDVSSGTLSFSGINSDGGFTYTPTTGFSGVDSFEYSVQDNWVLSDTATAYIYVLPATGQFVRWAFDGNLSDTSATPIHNASSSGTPVYNTAAADGKSLNLSGTTDYVSSDTADDSINGLSEFTVSFWIKSNTTGTDAGILRGTAADDNGFCVRYDAIGSASNTNIIRAGFTIDDSGQSQSIHIESSANAQSTDWTHVAVVWSAGNQLQMYINGELDTPTVNDAACSGEVAGLTTLVVGDGPDSSDSWDGLIDDFRVYNAALAADQVDALYHINPSVMPQSQAMAINAGYSRWLFSRKEDTRDENYVGDVTTYYYNFEDAVIHKRVQTYVSETNCISDLHHHYTYQNSMDLESEYLPDVWNFRSGYEFDTDAATGKFSFYSDSSYAIDSDYLNSSSGRIITTTWHETRNETTHELTDKRLRTSWKNGYSGQPVIVQEDVAYLAYQSDVNDNYAGSSLIRKTIRYPDGGTLDGDGNVQGGREVIEYLYNYDDEGELLDSLPDLFPFSPKKTTIRTYKSDTEYFDVTTEYDDGYVMLRTDDSCITTTYDYDTKHNITCEKTTYFAPDDTDPGYYREFSDIVNYTYAEHPSAYGQYNSSTSRSRTRLKLIDGVGAQFGGVDSKVEYSYVQLVSTASGGLYEGFALWGDYVYEDRTYTGIEDEIITGSIDVEISSVSGRSLSSRQYDLVGETQEIYGLRIDASNLVTLDPTAMVSRTDYLYTDGSDAHNRGKLKVTRTYSSYLSVGGIDTAHYIDTIYVYGDDGQLKYTERAGQSFNYTTEELTQYPANSGRYYWDRRSYPCIYETNWQCVGPVSCSLFDMQGNLAYVITAEISLSNNEEPTGQEALTSDNILTKKEFQYDWRGFTTYINHYQMPSDSVCSTEVLSYDYLGRLTLNRDVLGDFHQSVYDATGRIVEQRQGTTYVSESNNNLQITAKQQYDLNLLNGGASELASYVTGISRLSPNQDSASNLTYSAFLTSPAGLIRYVVYCGEYGYDYGTFERLRISVDQANSIYTIEALDEYSENVVKSESYYTENMPTSWHDFPGQYDQLLSRVEYAYDSNGLLTSQRVYEVDEGVVGNSLETQYFYDGAGRTCSVLQPTGLCSKYTYDAMNRVTGEYVCASADAGVLTPDSDTVVEQKLTYYHPNTGRAIITEHYLRNHDSTAVGALTASNSQMQVNVSWYGYFGQLLRQANYGDNDGVSFISEANPLDSSVDYDPAASGVQAYADGVESSDYCMVTTYEYNSLGQLATQTANNSVETCYYYDLNGRPAYTVENADNFDPSSESGTGDSVNPATDRVTRYAYSQFGVLESISALDANGDGNLDDTQTTYYIYGSDLTGADLTDYSPVPSHSMLVALVYPDSDDGISGGGLLYDGSDGDYDRVEFTYYANGQMATRKDQRGVVHAYEYTPAGLLESDSVTVVAAGVCDAVRCIRSEYDLLGRPVTVSTYSQAAPTIGTDTPLTQVVYEYNGTGGVLRQYQQHGGAVDANSLSVGYSYDDSSNSGVLTKGYRLAGVTYPDGTAFEYGYGTAGDISDLISRPESISDNSDASAPVEIVRYDYNGRSQSVRKEYPTPEIRLDYFGQLSSGDIVATSGSYPGFDRFGRVQQHLWYDEMASSLSDHRAIFDIQHEYDSASNRLSAERSVYPGHSQVYGYDDLNRLVSFNAGLMDTSGQAISDSWKLRGQGWTLDQLGNQGEVVDYNDPAASAPTSWYEGAFNDANEYTSRKIRADLSSPAQMTDDFSAINFIVPGSGDAASISGGELTFTSVYQDTGESDSRAFMLANSGPIGPAMFKVDINLPSTLSGEAGIVFGYLDFSNYYTATVDLASGLVAIKQVSGGVSATVESATLAAGTLQPNESYELVVVTDRRSINVADGLVVTDITSAVPSGYLGLISTSSAISFDNYTLYNSASQTDLAGRWACQHCRGYDDALLVGTVDTVADPDVFSSNAQARAMLKGLRNDNFEIICKASLCGGSTDDDFSFIFAHDGVGSYRSLKFNLAGSSPAAPTLWQVTEGKSPVNVPASSSDNLPAATNGYLWIRIACGGDSVGIVVQARASDLDPWDDVFSLVSPFSGHIGFSGGPVLIDDLSVRYYVDSSWVYAFVDDFDWGLDGFASQVPVYDGNGNLTYDGSRVYTYDSWNRLAAVSLALPDDTLTPADADGDPDIGPVIATFDYDGLGRRVSKVVTNSGSWDDSYDYYYDGWKLIETRNSDSDICSQYLWGLGYIDELCLIRWQFDALSVRQTHDYYALQDANYNVLGVVDADGDLVERYDYTPYGERRVYNHHHIVLSDYDDDGDVDLDDFITCNQNFGLTDATHDQGDSDGDGDVDMDDFILMKQEYGYVAQTGDALLYQSANESLTERGDIELCPFGHQGLFYDKETGLCDNRARYLNPAFGRFTSNDPKDQNTPGGGYHDGMNRFEYVLSNPSTLRDPNGLYGNITVHRKQVELKKDEDGNKDIGHEWIEKGNRSWGFYPSGSIFGSDGIIANNDPHHGERDGQNWETVKVNNMRGFFWGFNNRYMYDPDPGSQFDRKKAGCCADKNLSDVEACIRKWADFADKYRWYSVQNYQCRSWVRETFGNCCLEKKGAKTFWGYDVED